MSVVICAALVALTANCSAPPAPPEPKEDPSANAGPDQTVDAGQTVTLDASGSSDRHSEPILYIWTASSDNPAPVALTESAQIQFVPAAAGVYQFFLTIRAGERTSVVDTVSVTVVAIGNGPPVATAGLKTGPDTQSYTLDADRFVLDGSASTDPDGDQLTFLWELVSGPATVVIEDSSASQTSFAASNTGAYTFRLTVKDSIYSVTDELTINLKDAVGNALPQAMAVAAPDSVVSIGTTITLDGSGSFDDDGDSLIYKWSVEPDSVELSDSSAQQFTFTPSETGLYVFRLVVEDTRGADSQHAVINIVVVEVFTSRNGMIEIPAGEFVMGLADSEKAYERPPHVVDLSTFWIDSFEVTADQYRRCVDAGDCAKPASEPKCNEGKPDRTQHPVNCVNWEQASSYCHWAGKRLPTEAEWEKAARGDDGRLFPWGDTPGPFSIPRRLNWNNEVGSTTPVGSYPSGVSFYGIYDMAGNVNEWTADLYGVDYYQNSPLKDPQGPSEGQLRVARGGGWEIGQQAKAFYVTVRDAQNPTTRHHTIGFRCARTESP